MLCAALLAIDFTILCLFLPDFFFEVGNPDGIYLLSYFRVFFAGLTYFGKVPF